MSLGLRLHGRITRVTGGSRKAGFRLVLESDLPDTWMGIKLSMNSRQPLWANVRIEEPLFRFESALPCD